jgi:hypothetical protein
VKPSTTEVNCPPLASLNHGFFSFHFTMTTTGSISPRPHDGEMGPPPKRQKISQAPLKHDDNDNNNKNIDDDDKHVKFPSVTMHATVDGLDDFALDQEKERNVGILHFVNAANPGFSGVLKQR